MELSSDNHRSNYFHLSVALNYWDNIFEWRINNSTSDVNYLRFLQLINILLFLIQTKEVLLLFNRYKFE